MYNRLRKKNSTMCEKLIQRSWNPLSIRTQKWDTLKLKLRTPAEQDMWCHWWNETSPLIKIKEKNIIMNKSITISFWSNEESWLFCFVRTQRRNCCTNIELLAPYVHSMYTLLPHTRNVIRLESCHFHPDNKMSTLLKCVKLSIS